MLIQMKKNIFIVLLVGALCGGCGTSGEQKAEIGEQPDSAPLSTLQSPTPTPRTMGKVVAGRYADLSFETALPVERVPVKNGQQVRRGQVLAAQDTYRLQNAVEQQQQAVEQARLQIEQSSLQMQDVIIAQGYDPAGTVPESVRHNADMKAGYTLAQSRLSAAETQLEAARHQLAGATLTAPFDGTVANLTLQPHQLSTVGEPVCRVIASGEMQVEFRVMEVDLAQYPLGTKVTVVPVADQGCRYEATVSEINPVVDAQGGVTLRARLSAATGLFVGMNVEVTKR